MLTRQDELLIENDGEIVLPHVEYRTITYGDIKQKTAYSGRVIPIPFVLIEYLSYMELKLFALILDQIRTRTACYCSQREIAARLGYTEVAVCNASHNLVTMGFVTIIPKSRKRGKMINWKAIEYLTRITENRKPGAARFLRDKVGNKNVMNLTEIQLSHLDRFGGCKDEAENEEYD